VILTASWWLTPVNPYATLKVDDDCRLLLFSPDSSMLVTSGKQFLAPHEGPISVWDVAGGFERFSIDLDWKGAATVLFSPDSSLLAAQDLAGNLKIWNSRTGAEVANIKPGSHWRSWLHFRFSPDGQFLVFQDNSKGWPDKNYITFWNIESNKEQGTVESDIGTLAFAPDGNSFAAGRRKDEKFTKVLLWRMDEVPVLVKQHEITATELAFSPDVKTFVAADDLPDGNGEVVLRDMIAGEKIWASTFNGHDTRLESISFVAGGKILVAHSSGRTTLWDVTSTPKEIGSFTKTPAVSPDGKLLAIPLDTRFGPRSSVRGEGAKLIKTSEPEHATDLIVEGDFVEWGFYPDLRFSPDSKMIVATGLCRLEEEPFLGKWLPQGYNPVRPHPGGSIVRAWDTVSRRHVRPFSNCTEALFSPDGQVLATLLDGQAVDLWTVPLRASFWRALIWAGVGWLVVVSVYWLTFKAGKRRSSC
jgi:WD40 repeat protein